SGLSARHVCRRHARADPRDGLRFSRLSAAGFSRAGTDRVDRGIRRSRARPAAPLRRGEVLVPRLMSLASPKWRLAGGIGAFVIVGSFILDALHPDYEILYEGSFVTSAC